MAIIEAPPTGRSGAHKIIITVTSGFALAALALVSSGNHRKLMPSKFVSETVMSPDLEYDPTWPKPLPNPNWVLGAISGMSVDPVTDNVWVLHRGREPEAAIADPGPVIPGAPPESGLAIGYISCTGPQCTGTYEVAPPVILFSPEGDYIKSFGGPGEGYDWPLNPHFIHATTDGFLWIGGGLPTPHEYEYPKNKIHDAFVVKFTKDGEFVMQIGKPYETSGTNDPDGFDRPGLAFHEPVADELYVADGHGNVRISVHDATTGVQKREWGAYGSVPDITAPLEERYGRTVHGVAVSKDGVVYVCDRDRGLLHAHHTDGSFIMEVNVGDMFAQSMGPDATRGQMALLGFVGPWGVGFSPDDAQTYLYMATPDQMIFIIDRATLTLVSTYGKAGATAGDFNSMHSIQTDSASNVYVSEISHGRVQKFTHKGLVEVPKYAHLDLYTGTPALKDGTLYTVGLGSFILLLHMGCTPEMSESLCGIDSWIGDGW